ncbi:MAG: hypothetical protein V1790_14395 [Planctomycetota bacterium]
MRADFDGDPGRKVIEIEALNGIRLTDGADPILFICTWGSWHKARDPASPVTFADYYDRLYPGAIDRTVTESNAGKQAGPSGGAAPTEITDRLNDHDIEVLTVLKEAKKLLKVVEIVSRSGYCKPVVIKALKRFRELGFTHCPKGVRSGVGITPRGLEALGAAEGPLP